MMKMFIIYSSFFLMFSNRLLAQNAIVEKMASKIALKMRDTLSLNAIEQEKIYNINLWLSAQKTAIWQHKDYSDSQMTAALQNIENKRDSLYHTILPDDKFLLYKRKKINLVNNN